MDLEIHYADNWAALYVDGNLDRVGDAYLTEERAFELLGVKIVKDDAFMRGQEQASGAAQTLAEAVAYSDQQVARLRRAAELRAQADRLLAEAAALSA